MECEGRPREDMNGETDDEQNDALVKNLVAKKAVKTMAKKAVAKKEVKTMAKKEVKTVPKKTLKTVAKTADKQQKFKCSNNNCPFQTNNSANLKSHAVIHNRHGPEFPYSCKFCRASFGRSADKATHERIHEAEMEPTVRQVHSIKKATTKGQLKSVRGASMPVANSKSAANRVQPAIVTKVQLARGTSVSAAKFSGNSKLANRTVRFKSAADGGKSNNNNNSSGTKAKSILRNAGTTKRITRSQTKNQEKSEEEDNVEMMEPVKKPIGRQRRCRPTSNALVKNPAAAGPSSAGPSFSGSSAIANIFNACAKAGATLHDIDAVQGKIGKITPPSAQQKGTKNG